MPTLDFDPDVEAFATRLLQRVPYPALGPLAARVGIHPRRLRRLAKAELTLGPSLGEVTLLARAIGTTPAWLAFGVAA